jgi:hypothetical protein
MADVSHVTASAALADSGPSSSDSVASEHPAGSVLSLQVFKLYL